ncbi:MAG: zinc-binding dehydrogenase [Burkholderiaceae bacterium]|nr:zinc-binding dehydrogenase [Burkholderiaceae bacterium]
MSASIPTPSLQLRSLIKSSGELEISLASIATPEPGPEEVLVRIEASPMNPSDLGLLFGAADMSTAKASGTPEHPVITATVPEKLMKGMSGRMDQSMPVGNEGAGVVVKAGSSEAAQALLGKTVAILGGAMYAQYRSIKAVQCLVLPEGTTPAEGASCFVNPLTSLGMVETMRREGHKALVHTAAASNLGQMLNRICLKDGIGLVNIVRKQEQEDILRALGAVHVVNSSVPTFLDDLTRALVATGATIAFDAIGGGKLAGQILGCMEAAANLTAKEYSRYGSSTHKQVYIYGGLDRGPTEINRNFGMAWSVGGWLLTPFLQKIGFEAGQQLRQRVVSELKTTFASKYTREVSLAEALRLDAIAVYGKHSTGAKYLITPNKAA